MLPLQSWELVVQSWELVLRQRVRLGLAMLLLQSLGLMPHELLRVQGRSTLVLVL